MAKYAWDIAARDTDHLWPHPNIETSFRCDGFDSCRAKTLVLSKLPTWRSGIQPFEFLWRNDQRFGSGL